MSLEPLLAAPAAMQIHVAAVSGAFLVGTWNMLGPKGTAPHRARGRVFLALMIVAALSSFGIQTINKGGFSFLHVLSVFVLVMAPLAWWAARKGRIAAHRRGMIGLYFGGLWIPGTLALLPGRLLHQVVFSS